MPASVGVGGNSVDGGGGNVAVIVVPVVGGGGEPARTANACLSAGSATSGLVRASTAATSASASTVVVATLLRSYAGAPALPFDTRRSRPGGRSFCTFGFALASSFDVERFPPQAAITIAAAKTIPELNVERFTA